ncbi:MAG: prepilin-type N-terminal cleavage/methylation domain-containing protein [Candidatus Omnitrophica bacterium]|nr:prepilin-type N-terminal cleavage/methylation domain-containing protein [Candidatus Omnitrophota bacterium]MDD5670111.1 prepilin-type N-terminal cleavage/methylation domain-containing protein [Candidatus Omnitrophota bacterium]
MIKIAILSKFNEKDYTHSRGFTLVELIITSVILGFVLLSLVQLLGNLSKLGQGGNSRNKQTIIAQELMEDIRGRRFDEFVSKSGSNWSTTLGTNSGESSSNKSSFDDVDDFNSWTENLGAPYTGYTTSVAVCYVNSSNLNTCVASSPTTEFKLVQVTVSKTGVPNLVLKSVVSSARSRLDSY